MTPIAREFSQQERERAAGQMYVRKFGCEVPDENWLFGWARDAGSDFSRAIDTQCELNHLTAQVEEARAKIVELTDALMWAVEGEEDTAVAYAYCIEGGRKQRAEMALIDAEIAKANPVRTEEKV